MFEKKYLDQVKILLNILPLIGKHKEFAIKGGTAINFFIFNVPRLSVDIDLCYLPIESRESTFKKINILIKEIAESVKKRFPEYTINLMKSGSANIYKLIISGNRVSVKIEPNELLRGNVKKSEIRRIRKEVAAIFNLFPEAHILSTSDIFGGKICAAFDRQHPRDLFDIYMMFENNIFNEEVKKVFLIYLIQSGRPISEMLNPNKLDISKPYNNEFKGMVNKDITIDQLYSAREKLVKTITSNINPNEKEFLLSVKKGEPDWDKLEIGNFLHLPGVQWKLQNIKKISKEKKLKAYKKLEKILSL